MDETDVIVTSDDARTCPRGHWRPSEDEKLHQHVEQYGPQNWNRFVYIYIYQFLLSYVNTESMF